MEKEQNQPEQPPPPSPEEIMFREWRNSEATQAFFKYLGGLRQETMERWAQGTFHSDNHQVFINRSAMALGGTKLLADLINLEYKDIEDFYNERNEHFGN